MWTKHYIESLGYTTDVIIYEDNDVAKWSRDPKRTALTKLKHLRHKYRYIRQHVTTREFQKIKKCWTERRITDLFTKIKESMRVFWLLTDLASGRSVIDFD